MAIYYVDPTATGLNNGTTQANAWTSLQRAISGTDGTQPGAGDTVLCRAQDGVTPDEILTAQIDVNGLSGTIGNYLKFIGVNSSWVNDGTKYVINGNSSFSNCLYFGAMDYHAWYNFKCYGAINYQVEFVVSGASYCDLYNFHCSGGSGVRMLRNTYGSFIGGIVENSANGLYNLSGDCLFSTIRNCSGTGIDFVSSGLNVVGCLIHGNGTGIFCGTSGGGLIMNNIIHGNSTGILSGALKSVIGNRLTNNTTGVDAQARSHIIDANYFQNTTDIVNGGNILTLSPVGIDLNTWAGTDIGYGYVDAANGNFNLTADATMRRVPITLPS